MVNLKSGQFDLLVNLKFWIFILWGFDVWSSVRAYNMALSSNSLLLLWSDHYESYIVYYLYLICVKQCIFCGSSIADSWKAYLCVYTCCDVLFFVSFMTWVGSDDYLLSTE